MLCTSVYTEVTEHLATELIFGEHATDSIFHHTGRMLSHHVSSSYHSLPTRVPGVADIFFLSPLVSGEPDFICVEDNYVVTTVYMRSVGRLMLSTKNGSNLARSTALEPFLLHQ